jgi:hypothetical protein
MEVSHVKQNWLETIGTYVLVGAASAAGAALWSKVLEREVGEFAQKRHRPKSEKLIDFKEAKRRLSR